MSERAVRILHVDDNDANRYAVSRSLVKAGFDVAEAATGGEALAKVADKPDLVILDVRLPDIDGFEVCRRIKADPRTASTPVLHLSASFVSGRDKAHGLDSGADGYLVRPVEPVELVATVNALLRVRRSEEALRQSEEQYRRLIDSIKDYAIFMVDPEGRVSSWNVGAERLLGYTEAEIVGRPTSLLFTPEDVAAGVPAGEMRNAAGRGSSPDFRWHLRKDGSRLFVDGVMTAVRDAAGALVGFSKLMQDVTERKKAEETLVLHSPVLESMSEGVSVCDEQGYIHYTNPAEDVMFGYAAGELIGQRVTVQNAYPAAENERKVAEVIEQLKATGVWTGEWHNRRKDGTEFYTHAHITALQTSTKRHWVCVQRDVTEQRRAAGALRESEARFRELANAMPQIVWTARPDGSVDYYNDRWYEYTGAGRGTVGDESWEAAVHPEDLARTRRTWHAAVLDKKLYELECRFLEGKTGRYRWHLSRAVPALDGAGAVTRWFGACTDIEDHKRNESALRRATEAAEAARSAAETANRLKDDFLATLSHELRTPLNAIIGWSQILRSDGCGADDLAEGLETIERNARAQAQLIEDLLDVSRIISGKLRLDVQPVELSAVIDAAAASVHPAAQAKGVRLQRVLDPRDTTVAGDPARLQQVVWNLLSNAIKFTPRGGRVLVTLARVNSHAEIVVADTGQGIAPEFVPHVFERFRQADATSRRQQGGLGLGLAIVRHLVELHGGTVAAASDGPNTGATFTVHLPVSVVNPPRPAVRPEPAAPGRRAAAAEPSPDAQPLECDPVLEGVRILIVDDEADARNLLRRILLPCKASIETAGSTREALAALAAQKFDVLLSDIGMPGEDGYDLIRAVPRTPPAQNGRIPAIALTAFARPEDRRRVLLAGFQVHVAKPVDPKELLAVLASAVGRTGGGAFPP